MRLIFFLLFACSLTASTPLFDTDNAPSKELLDLLSVTKTRHKGTLKSIFEAVEKHWNQGEKERWELKELYADKKEDILSIAQAMGYLDAIHASKKHYTYAVVRGALQKTVTLRLQFLIDEWKRGVRFDHIVFLSGFRTPLPEAEPLANHSSQPETEADLIRLVYAQTPMPPEMRRLPVTFIDAPAAPGRKRATTASSTLKWINTNPQPGSCLVVSSQPYVQYQHIVVSLFLPDTFPIETIGPKPQKEPSPQIILDTVEKSILWTALRNF